jgi:hypothetical protein
MTTFHETSPTIICNGRLRSTETSALGTASTIPWLICMAASTIVSSAQRFGYVAVADGMDDERKR